MSLFSDLFSSKPAQQAASDQIAALNQGKSNAMGALDTGQSQATGAYGSALDNSNNLYSRAYQPFSQLYTQAQPGMSAYADATGANGAEGLARARANFTADPGYSGGLMTGIDQVMRTAAARGDLGGGNTSADEIKFASDYDANKYGNYVSGLAPWLSAGNSAASGGASVLGANANADTGIYGAQAGMDTNLAGARSGIDTQTAQGVGNAQAQSDLAPYSASQNFWGALMGAGKLAVSTATGMPMGGGGGSTPLSPGLNVPGATGPSSVGGPNGPMPVWG